MTSRSLDDYLNLITSEHRNKPKFVAALSAVLQPLVDEQQRLAEIPPLYDLDSATGSRLDAVGKWIGRSRNVPVPIADVYFSFDTEGVGFDQGVWLGPFDPTTGLVSLPDDFYRLILRAKILLNRWDGTIPQAYEIWDTIFQGTGFSMVIIDNQDMSMDFGLVGNTAPPLTIALLLAGYLTPKPSGVRVAAYITPSVPMTPFFGFDVENDVIAGFDVGSWSVDL